MVIISITFSGFNSNRKTSYGDKFYKNFTQWQCAVSNLPFSKAENDKTCVDGGAAVSRFKFAFCKAGEWQNLR